MSSPLVTVLTPVFNGEAHLVECIESVIGQTYDNWEYVIVDNCSSDRTEEIARRFAADDSRIRYERHDEFVDAVASHNRAFAQVGPKTDYCKVVGADDWLYPNCLSSMVQLAEEHPEVGVVGSYRLTERGVDLTGRGRIPYWQTTMNGRDVVSGELRERLTVLGSPTSLLLRADLLRKRHPFYSPSLRHADTEAGLWGLMHSDFGVVHQVLTYSRPSPASETAVSDRLASSPAERLWCLVHYGPNAMTPDEYRSELRMRLGLYVRMHAKLALFRSKLSNPALREFHRRRIELILSECDGDLEVRLALGLVQRLIHD